MKVYKVAQYKKQWINFLYILILIALYICAAWLRYSPIDYDLTAYSIIILIALVSSISIMDYLTNKPMYFHIDEEKYQVFFYKTKYVVYFDQLKQIVKNDSVYYIELINEDVYKYSVSPREFREVKRRIKKGKYASLEAVINIIAKKGNLKITDLSPEKKKSFWDFDFDS